MAEEFNNIEGSDETPRESNGSRWPEPNKPEGTVNELQDSVQEEVASNDESGKLTDTVHGEAMSDTGANNKPKDIGEIKEGKPAASTANTSSYENYFSGSAQSSSYSPYSNRNTGNGNNPYANNHQNGTHSTVQYAAPEGTGQSVPVYTQQPYQGAYYGNVWHNGTAQPDYGQQGYTQANNHQQNYQAGYYQQPNQTMIKQKMPTALKIFLVIISLVVIAVIAAFTLFVVNTADSSSNVVEVPPGIEGGNYEDFFNEYGEYFEDPKYNDDFGNGNESPPIVDDDVVPDADAPLPDVEVTPNHEGIAIEKRPSTAELDAKAVYKKIAPSTVTVGATMPTSSGDATTTGTGIIATSDGYVITNSHVVFDSKNTILKITTNDGEEYEAVVVGVDRSTDLAVLKMNDHNFTPAEFGDTGELSIGEWVLAIGNPGGEKFSSSLTRGIISGLDRTVGEYSENGMTYIQTDAAINPGNSGGPLVNMYGQVVGINSSKIITTGYEGMGFAIPVSGAQEIINELLSGGYVKGRTRLGITGGDVSELEAQMYNIPLGFKIATINNDSAFNGSKVEAGDIITAIDGNEVTGISSISNTLLKYHPGDKIKVTLYRSSTDTSFDVEIVLLEDKGETQQ